MPRSRTSGLEDDPIFALSTLLHGGYTIYTVLPPMPGGSNFCISLTTLDIDCLFLYSNHSNWYDVIIHCGFELPFPQTAKHFSMGLLSKHVFFFEKCLFPVAKWGFHCCFVIRVLYIFYVLTPDHIYGLSTCPLSPQATFHSAEDALWCTEVNGLFSASASRMPALSG